MLKSLKIDKTWTLFLDRDGVINKRIVDDYVLRVEQFEFLPGVVDAIVAFSKMFNRIVVVTNQQGIGKGMMTESDLHEIHSAMRKAIEAKGGKIDEVYFCPDLKEKKSLYRKPNIGMALKAKKQFADINFKKSIMVGDSLSDMQFGKRAGMITVFANPNPHVAKKYPEFVDYYFEGLSDFSEVLK
ncbi:MAG: HAD family hydrolase [Bacteroidota bacterium]